MRKNNPRDLDFEYISNITGVSTSELKKRFKLWFESGKRSKKDVDLKLIAALSGVSVSSVSNYCNKKKGAISLEKTLMLDKLVDHLEYIPSNAAKKLRSTTKMSIGYIAPLTQSSSTEYYIEILKGIKEEAVKFGYSIDIYDISDENEKEYYSKLPFMGLVDGLIIVSSVLTAEDLAPLYLKQIPVFHINPRIEETRAPFVGSVFSEADPFSQLLEHLFNVHNYRNPVLLSLEINHYSQREEKYKIFKDSMDQFGISFSEDKNVVFLKSFSYAEGGRGYEVASSKNPEADVFICLSDIIAVPVLRALEKNKKQTAVTGYADFEIASVFDLTTIDQDIKSLGVKAFQQIYYALKYIQQNREFPDYSVHNINVKFIKRESCGCR